MNFLVICGPWILHIKRLREKLNRASPKAAAMIHTVWGVGYKLEVPKD